MDPLLFNTAREGNVEAFLMFLREDPLILERVATTSADTPLHIAAMLGHLEFVKELILHKSNIAEYVKELNQHGFSPLHLASANGHVEVVKELLKVSNGLCNLKGWDGLTPLHCASIKGRAEILILLLSASPTCVLEVTASSETALHLAVKNNQLEALSKLVAVLKLQNLLKILNSKDKEGNTVLHLAAVRKNGQVIELLLNCNNESPGVLQINVTNNRGLTPLDLFLLCPCESNQAELERLLRLVGAARAQDSNDISLAPPSQVPSQPNPSIPTGIVAPSSIPVPATPNQHEVKSWEDYFKFDYLKTTPSEVRNALLVVAVLMATATYQAGLTPLGGVYQDGSNKGQALLASTPVSFIWFIFFNSAGFFISMKNIMVLTGGFPMFWELYVAIIAMVVTYDSALFQASPPNYLRTVFGMFCTLMPIALGFIPAQIRKYYRRRRGAPGYRDLMTV